MITTCRKGLYEWFIEIIQVLLKTYLKEINLSLFITETFSQWLWSYSKLRKIFPIQYYVTYFRQEQCYNLRSQTGFIRSIASTSQHRLNRSNASTSQHGLNSMRCFTSKLWQTIPLEIKNSVSIKSFKEKIRKWEPSNCHYKLCQPHIHNLGYENLI